MDFKFQSAADVQQVIERKKEVKQKQLIQADIIKAGIAKMLENESYRCGVDIKFEDLDSEIREQLEAKGYYLYKNCYGKLVVSVIE